MVVECTAAAPKREKKCIIKMKERMPCKWFMTRNFFTATTAEHFFFVSTLFVYKGSRAEKKAGLISTTLVGLEQKSRKRN